MPCRLLFEEQDAAYKRAVMGETSARVAVEAAVELGWERYLGFEGRFVGMHGFGASGKIARRLREVRHHDRGGRACRPRGRPGGRRLSGGGCAAQAAGRWASRRPSGRAGASPPDPRAASGWSRVRAREARPPRPARLGRPDVGRLWLGGASRPPHLSGSRRSVPKAAGRCSPRACRTGRREMFHVAGPPGSRRRRRRGLARRPQPTPHPLGRPRPLGRAGEIVGITTNPTIFAKAIGAGSGYEDQVRDLALRGTAIGETLRLLTAWDVRAACDVLRPVFDRTGRRDGRVSIEVDPRLARDGDRTAAEARGLWWLVDRPNLFIKIPATLAGLPAIAASIADGISVNVTLIFSVSRYEAVLDAYMAGLERRAARGDGLEGIESVASFFVSRVDTEVDRRLADIADQSGRRSRQGCRGTTAWPGGAREQPPGLPPLRAGVGVRPLEGAGGEGGPDAASAVGIDGGEGREVRGYALRRRAGRAGHGQHHA